MSAIFMADLSREIPSTTTGLGDLKAKMANVDGRLCLRLRLRPGRHGQPEENQDRLIEPQDVLVI
jgi:hypothetical protein